MKRIKSFNLNGLSSYVNHRKRLLVAVCTTVAVLCILIATATAIASNWRLSKLADPKVTTSGLLKPVPPRQPSVQVVQFTLYDVGIYPREVHAQKGVIAISIEDLSGGTSGVIIERKNGNASERAGRVVREKHDWRARNEIELNPGRYEVYDADRTDNRSVLIIEP